MTKKPTSLTAQAVRALQSAVAKVVDDHRRRGRPLAVWRDGRAVWQPVGPASAAAVVQEAPTPYAKKSHAPRR